MQSPLLPDVLVDRHERVPPLPHPRLVPQKFGELIQQVVPIAGAGILVQVPYYE